MKQAFLTAALILSSLALSNAEQPPYSGSGQVFRIERIVTRSGPQDDLPPAASALLRTFDGQSEQIRARADSEIALKRETLIQQLQAMQDAFTREARLDEAVAIRDAIRQLKRAGITVLPNPESLISYRGQLEKVLHFEVLGSLSGAIYGTDIYTDDSNLSVAAVHSGALGPGEKGVVKVTILPGQSSYVSTVRNGVTSSAWHEYPGSYKVEPLSGDRRIVATTRSTILPDPGSLWKYEKQVGQAFEFQVTGSMRGGTVWGTGIYTGDSPLAVAAVHAGVLRDGESGVVKVTMLDGDSRYLGSTRNGVSSNDYGPYPFGYRIDPVTPELRTTPRLLQPRGRGFGPRLIDFPEGINPAAGSESIENKAAGGDVLKPFPVLKVLNPSSSAVNP